MSDKIKHWSKVEYLHQAVTNPNIHVKGINSYYSECWDEGFEKSVVRYLHGDNISQQWTPLGTVDQLWIGDYVCIAAEVIILMGGNNTHRTDWFSIYPFMQTIQQAYIARGDTHLDNGCWIGMRAMLMPGVTIGEGAIVAAGSVVTTNVEPYTIVAGNPARLVRARFEPSVISRLLALNIYRLSAGEFAVIRPYLTANNIDELEQAVATLSVS